MLQITQEKHANYYKGNCPNSACVSEPTRLHQVPFSSILYTEIKSRNKRNKPLILSNIENNIENTFDFFTECIPRDPYRLDFTFNDYCIEMMVKENKTFKYIYDEVLLFRHEKCKCANIYWHLVVVKSGAVDQENHCDAPNKNCYYTIIIPLTNDINSGGTVFPHMDNNKEFKDFIVFDGKLPHYGTGNRSNKARLFMYAVLTSGEDPN